MTDPTPQGGQEWFCISCNHLHAMHQNVPNGQSCRCGGCTAWVPELRPAEPSPAPQAPVHDGSEHYYAENFGMRVGTPAAPAERVIEVAPQEDCGGHCGACDTRHGDLEVQIRSLEAALTAMRDERHVCPECDRPMSLLSNGPTEYKYVCEFCEFMEENERLTGERDRARDALREILEIGKRDMSNPKYDFYFENARAALKPVSDRQPEGETKVKRLQAFWRAWWHLCPRCNSDAPEIDTCQACESWRGPHPAPDWLVSTWLMRHFEPQEWSKNAGKQ